MIYLFIFIALLLLAIAEIIKGYGQKKIFNISVIILTLLAACRFGVGTDYFSYMYIYDFTPSVLEPNFLYSGVYGEFGYQVLQGIFKVFDLSFTTFIFVLSIGTMYLFYKYIIENSRLYMTSLLIFYSMYYFTYINSGIRQALAIGLFLVVLLPLLKAKKYVKYFVCAILFCFIHSSVVVVLALPFLNFKFDLKKFGVLVVFALALNFIDLRFLLPIEYLALKQQAYADAGVNIMAILSRTTILTMIVTLLLLVKDKINENERKIFNLYIAGFLLYLLFVSNEALSSRLHVYFKCFEIILIPNFISLVKSAHKRLIYAYILVVLMVVMWQKEVNACLEQAVYYEQGGVYDYPYTSIFNKNEVYLYRPVRYNFEETN